MTPPVKNNTVGTNITKATIISVDNDIIKAMNKRISTKMKANPRNMKKPKIINNIKTGIEIIMMGDTINANKNKNGSPSSMKGKNTKNTKPNPNKINGLKTIKVNVIPTKASTPITKKEAIVKNIRAPIKITAMIIKPTNKNSPASMNGNSIKSIDTMPLNIIVATIEKAVIGMDNKNITNAAPIQNIKLTIANIIKPTKADP